MFACPKVVTIVPDVFFWKLYILAASAFISKIHLELVFLYSVRFFFFPYGYEVFSICWKYFPFPIECLWSLCWKSIDYMIVCLFLDSLLLHWSVCLSLCYHLHFHGCCGFSVHLKVRLWVLKFCSLPRLFGPPWIPWFFPVIFRIRLSISTKKPAETFTGIVLNLQSTEPWY